MLKLFVIAIFAIAVFFPKVNALFLYDMRKGGTSGVQADHEHQLDAYVTVMSEGARKASGPADDLS